MSSAGASRRRSGPLLIVLALGPALWTEEGVGALLQHREWGILWVALGGLNLMLLLSTRLARSLSPMRASSGEVTFSFDVRIEAALAALGVSWLGLVVVSSIRRPTQIWLWFDVGLLAVMTLSFCGFLARRALSKLPALVIGPEGLDVSVLSQMVHLDWDEIDHMALSQPWFGTSTLGVFACDPPSVVSLLPRRWQGARRRSAERGRATLFVGLSRLGLTRLSAMEGDLGSALDRWSGGRFETQRRSSG